MSSRSAQQDDAVFTSAAEHGVRNIEPYLADFIKAAKSETELLRLNGARAAASARDRLIDQLIAAVNQHYDELVDVRTAATLTGRCPETIRRALRNGGLADARPNTRGRHKIRRGDLARIAPRHRDGYDLNADAQDIARRRSKL